MYWVHVDGFVGRGEGVYWVYVDGFVGRGCTGCMWIWDKKIDNNVLLLNYT